MTRRLRPPYRTAGAALAAAALLAAAPASATPARTPALAAPAFPGRAAWVPAVAGEVPQEAYEELAGSAAGVGRERPGRPADAPPDPGLAAASRPVRPVPPARPLQPAHERPEPVAPRPDPVPDPSATGTAPAPTPVTALGNEPNERAADLAAHLLPLGTGLALMGLGIGYMGVRLRRGR
ncbi:hypothetical protein [Streptomyces sp. W1SF4]|uniref:hypothetical protein n=1 Tax=Streptomyces sp. W1SF4 TaxID=2305220 RepID=UPI000F6C3E72|nr:hypothetical protein [Streptomyces sp. W1SF4]AZM89989.1 hypothetical protein D1J60_17200 [Streptomyces sp. W1SF4]